FKRVLSKIETIVREELDAVGYQELFMPAMQPRELWDESGRWERYTTEGILFHMADRKGSEVCLGPTHEEVVTDFVRSRIQSHKQLPIHLYQIQTKFRDEIRPRFGVMRGREFLMKDAYSFDASADAMAASYEVMRGVYERAFSRCGLRFTAVQADSGAIGGSASEEFMVDAESGEDAIAVCRKTGYAANLERATSTIPSSPSAPEKVEMHKEPTPDAKSCDDLVEIFPEIPLARMLKTVLYKVQWPEKEQVIAILCRGDRELNEVKLLNYLDALHLELANEKSVTEITGASPGFAGPIGLPSSVRLLADSSVQGVEGFLCGANETDVHLLDVWFGRDIDQPETLDLGLVQEGDATADGEGTIEITRGIEVGHIFQLGTKYSESMDAVFTDENQDRQPIWMGCYGLGVSRTAAAAVEQGNDDSGMIWPLPIAPYSVALLQLQPGDDVQDNLAQSIYEKLEAAGIDVLWDDRPKLNPGARFKDADLVGIPLRIVVGRNAVDGQVEWSLRSGGDSEVVSGDEAVSRALAAWQESVN
ncbi:MAG TPA: proline--tRNA ligase, partial [Planctomycetes bacterium]|nr:proline--tRNA ligase [Planctomycetota bacterium]